MRAALFILASALLIACAAAPNQHSPVSGEQTATADGGVAWVEWSVTNEHNIAEFRVLRGTDPGGPWTLIATIPGQGAGTHGPQTYQVDDRGLEVGRVYHYLIENENTAGQTNRAGPIPYEARPEEAPE